MMGGGHGDEVVIKKCEILTSELLRLAGESSSGERGERGAGRIFTHSQINRLLSLVVSNCSGSDSR